MQGKEAGQQTIACSREELLEEESITALTRAASSMPHPLGKPSLWRCGGYLAYLFVSCKLKVSRALSLEQPPAYTMSRPRSAPVLGPYQAKLEELLAENQRLPKKQRYTAHKLFQLIQAEGYGGSEAGVQMYAVRWRKANKR